MGRLVGVVAALAVVSAACGGQTTVLSGREIVSAIPWTAAETARYRLLEGDDLRGSGELRIESQGQLLILTQKFEFPSENLRDEVSTVVDAATLRPSRVERIINGPQGERRCRAEYGGNMVTVEQRAEDDKRTDRFAVPSRSYDSWSDLFLWRTLAFGEGYESTYADVLSCTLTKPQVLSVVLKVKGLETVTVPEGAFQAWRLEIRSGGRTQKAWYENDAARTLIRYDNGDIVFELEARE